MISNKVFEEYEGKNIYHCYSMGSRINFNADNISLCHGIEIGDVCLKKSIDDGISSEWYIKTIKEIIDKCQDEQFPCRKCSNMKYKNFHFEGIKIVTINTTRKCNSKCIYCPVCQDKSGKCYNPLPFIQKFINEGIISPDCLFDWGGGEPVLNDFFVNTFEYLYTHGYKQRVNSNCIQFSDSIYNALKQGKCILRTSLDSGTPESFLRVKGVNKFNETCRNIEKYVSANVDNVVLKYVLNSANCEKESIIGFLEFCKKNGVNRVCLDADSFSYASKDYNGPLYFTDREMNAARLFVNSAKKANMDVDIGYVYTAYTDSESRDGNGTSSYSYCLPDKTVKSEWKDIFTQKRYAVPCASLEALLAEVNSNEVVLVGKFTIAKIIEKAIRKKGINIVKKISIKEICDVKLIQELINKYPQIVFIVANERYGETIREINQLGIKNFSNKVICMDTFRYIESLENYNRKQKMIGILRKIRMMR